MSPLALLLRLAIAAAVGYLAVLAVLWRYARSHPGIGTAREALRLLPDLVVLLRRLAGDTDVPRSVRLALVLLAGYLACPIDLVPDVVPVLGYADDAIALALVLRLLVRRAGPAALRRAWPGTPAGLRVVEALAGLPSAP